MVKWISLLFSVLVASLFAYALWLRTTSLEVLPEVNGDEVWHAIQLTRLMRGESYTLLTESNLVLSPFHAALELPFLLLFKPSLWLVRLPALMTGIAAVILIYVLGSRMLDRTTALIAAALVAVLPVAIIFSRVSYESSHAPLYGILILYFASRLNIVAVVLMLSMSYFIHPTNIFLLPVLLGVVLVRSKEQCPEDPARLRQLVLVRTAAITGTVMAVGLLTMLNPSTKRLSKAFDTGLGGRHDFFEFCSNYERLFLGGHSAPDPIRTGVFWTIFVLVFSLGLGRLVATRRWDRVVLVVGSLLSALALFVMGGSNIIMPASARYGLYLITPTCLAVACLVNALLVNRDSVRLAWLRPLQFAGIVAVGWCLLLSVDLTHVTKWSFMAADFHNEQESPWTFRADARAPLRKVSSLIAYDIDARAHQLELEAGEKSKNPTVDAAAIAAKVQSTPVFAHAWWAYGALEWLTISRRDIQVTNFDFLPPDEEKRFALLKDCLLRGGYVVTYATPPCMEPIVLRLFPAESLKKWEIPQSNGQPYLMVLRLKWSVQNPQLSRLEPQADRDSSARTIK